MLSVATLAWVASVSASTNNSSAAFSETALRDAMRRADAASLMAQYQHPSDAVSRALAAMALDRVTWQLGNSSATARTCAKALAESQPVTAFFCAKFEAGNLRLMGRYADAARADTAAGANFKVVAEADPSFQSFLRDNPTYAAMPPVTVEREGDVTVPVNFDAAHAFTVAISINGQQLNVGLDTGAPTTLTRDTAHRIGVQIVVADHGKATGFLGKSSPQSLGIIDTLQLGGVTVRHVPVEVVEEGRDVIGNDLLMQLGRFRLTHAALELPAGNDALASCQEPMLVSTAAFGGATLLVKPLVIDGKSRLTLLDTGDSFVLTGAAGAVGSASSQGRRTVHTRDLTHADRDVETLQSHARVEYAGRIREVDASIFPDAHLPYDYILGGGALTEVSLEVDFDNSHVCLVQHQA
jgi:hypothetical protein